MGRYVRHDDARAPRAEMTVLATQIAGVYLAEAAATPDRRGIVARLFDLEELRALGVDTDFSHALVAFNEATATLRGLHYQAPPYGETKVVRCTAGALFDVVVDLRPDSSTWRGWMAVELSAENRRSLVVPPGCAHGYLTLAPCSEVSYLISSPYVEDAQRGVR